MRFFTTLHKAGRLEYFLVQLVIFAATYFLFVNVLEVSFSVAQEGFTTDRFVFNEGNLGLFAVGYAITFYVGWVNVARRLKDMNLGFVWALLLFVPVIGVLFQIYLMVAKGISDKTYTPYGNDPYDPNSWVPPETSHSGSAVTYQGSDIYLPGEETWNDDQAA